MSTFLEFFPMLRWSLQGGDHVLRGHSQIGTPSQLCVSQDQRHCQKGEIPAVTPAPLENTDEHDVAPDRVPGPGALSGRTRENFITTHQGGTQTDGQEK